MNLWLRFERLRCFLTGHCPCDPCRRDRVCLLCGSTERLDVRV